MDHLASIPCRFALERSAVRRDFLLSRFCRSVSFNNGKRNSDAEPSGRRNETPRIWSEPGVVAIPETRIAWTEFAGRLIASGFVEKSTPCVLALAPLASSLTSTRHPEALDRRQRDSVA